MVGHQWPNDAPLAAVRAGSAGRAAAARSFEDYAGLLTGIEQGPLARQDGATADDARARFRSGAEHALRIAERQRLTGLAYESAQNCVAELRSALSTIAAEAQGEIQQIAASGQPLATRVARITEVVRDAQDRADGCAATHGGALLTTIQTVLAGSGSELSARSFAGSHGVNLDAAYRRQSATVEAAVTGLLGGGETGPPAQATAPDPSAALGPASAPAAAAGRQDTRQDTRPATRPEMTASRTVTGRPEPAGKAPGAAAAGPAAASAAQAAGAPGNRPGPTASGPVATVRPTVPPAGPGRARQAQTAHAHPAEPVIDPRLRRPLLTLARQEPALRWAVGEHPDGTVVAATDLAGGWIPPHVGIPATVRLPPPTGTRGGLHEILGPTVRVESYRPGLPLPGIAGADLEPVSNQPRRAGTAGKVFKDLRNLKYLEDLEDLGRQLRTATRRRAGLPRLAHTLADAVSAGTACPESEVAPLGDHIAELRRRVLAAYPGPVDPAQIADWQLMAAVEALARGEPELGHYHFSWWQQGEESRCRT